MQALGLIETKGFVGAVEGADAMLKTADVRLLEKTLATGGLVTVTICGDVAAVQASVEAARATISRIDGAELVSTHVIPRPDDQLAAILKLDPDYSINPAAQDDQAPEPGTPEEDGPQGDVGQSAPDESLAGTPSAVSEETSEEASEEALEESLGEKPEEVLEAPAEQVLEETSAGSAGDLPAEEVVPEKPAEAAAEDPVEEPAAQPGAAKPQPRAKAAPRGARQTGKSAREKPRGPEAELTAMSLGKLRTLARSRKIDLGGKDISQASKKALVTALLRAESSGQEKE